MSVLVGSLDFFFPRDDTPTLRSYALFFTLGWCVEKTYQPSVNRTNPVLVRLRLQPSPLFRSGWLFIFCFAGADKVAWTAADALVADLSNTFSGAEVVISCIGVIGGSDAYMEKGNGEVNVRAINQAKAAGVPKFVYVSVASIVPSAVDGAGASTPERRRKSSFRCGCQWWSCCVCCRSRWWWGY